MCARMSACVCMCVRACLCVCARMSACVCMCVCPGGYISHLYKHMPQAPPRLPPQLPPPPAHTDPPLLADLTDPPLLADHTDPPLLADHTDPPLLAHHNLTDLSTRLQAPHDGKSPRKAPRNAAATALTDGGAACDVVGAGGPVPGSDAITGQRQQRKGQPRKGQVEQEQEHQPGQQQPTRRKGQQQQQEAELEQEQQPGQQKQQRRKGQQQQQQQAEPEQQQQQRKGQQQPRRGGSGSQGGGQPGAGREGSRQGGGQPGAAREGGGAQAAPEAQKKITIRRLKGAAAEAEGTEHEDLLGDFHLHQQQRQQWRPRTEGAGSPTRLAPLQGDAASLQAGFGGGAAPAGVEAYDGCQQQQQQQGEYTHGMEAGGYDYSSRQGAEAGGYAYMSGQGYDYAGGQGYPPMVPGMPAPQQPYYPQDPPLQPGYGAQYASQSFSGVYGEAQGSLEAGGSYPYQVDAQLGGGGGAEGAAELQRLLVGAPVVVGPEGGATGEEEEEDLTDTLAALLGVPRAQPVLAVMSRPAPSHLQQQQQQLGALSVLPMPPHQQQQQHAAAPSLQQQHLHLHLPADLDDSPDEYRRQQQQHLPADLDEYRRQQQQQGTQFLLQQQQERQRLHAALTRMQGHDSFTDVDAAAPLPHPGKGRGRPGAAGPAGYVGAGAAGRESGGGAPPGDPSASQSEAHGVKGKSWAAVAGGARGRQVRRGGRAGESTSCVRGGAGGRAGGRAGARSVCVWWWGGARS